MYKKWFSDYYWTEIIILGLCLVMLFIVTGSLVVNVINDGNIIQPLVILAIVVAFSFLVMLFFYQFKLKVIMCLKKSYKPVIAICGNDNYINGWKITFRNKSYYCCKIEKDILGDIVLLKTPSNPNFLIETKYYSVVERIYQESPETFDELIESNKIVLTNENLLKDATTEK